MEKIVAVDKKVIDSISLEKCEGLQAADILALCVLFERIGKNVKALPDTERTSDLRARSNSSYRASVLRYHHFAPSLYSSLYIWLE